MFTPSDFILRPEYFDHSGSLHGMGHTYRVMTMVYLLGEELKLGKKRDLAFMAAFIHDMARKHDGFCMHHGKWAAKSKLPLFSDLFINNGAANSDLDEIAFAVKNHSLYLHPGKSHPYYTTLALLKDADALDRIRIRADDLNPDYLRFKISHSFIKTSEKLYYSTKHLKEMHPLELIETAKSIRDMELG